MWPDPLDADPDHRHTEYTQYVNHLKKDLGIDVSHFSKNVGAMVNGYLNAVTDADSRLRGILKPGTSGFG